LSIRPLPGEAEGVEASAIPEKNRIGALVVAARNQIPTAPASPGFWVGERLYSSRNRLEIGSVAGVGSEIVIDIYVWTLDVDAHERERIRGHLSQDERGRAARFVTQRDRERFVAARGRLREILAKYAACDPAAVAFNYNPHGKPRLRGGGPNFNLSHSENLAILAIADSAEIGVDLEAIRPLREDIAERFFSPTEVLELRGLPDDDQVKGFYRCWTLKEAFVKAVGMGLTLPLDGFDVSIAGPPRLNRLASEFGAKEDWSLVQLEPSPGFVGAICCRSGGLSLHLRRPPT